MTTDAAPNAATNEQTGSATLGLDAMADALEAEELAAAGVTPESTDAAGTGEQQGTDADGAGQASGTGDQNADASAQGTSDGDGDGLGDLDAELAQLRGQETPPAGETSEEPKQPGQSLEDVAAEQQRQSAGQYAQLMQAADRDEIQPFLRDELGLEPGQAQAAWEKMRQIFGRLHAGNEAHNLLLTDQLLRQSMTEEEQAEYSKRSYVVRDPQGRVLPLSSRLEAFKGVLALREQKVNRDWEEKVKKGEFATKAEVSQIREAAFRKGVAKGEKTQSVARSGQTPAGVSGETRTPGGETLEDIDSMSVEQLMKAGY